jgi:hypothetical protein
LFESLHVAHFDLDASSTDGSVSLFPYLDPNGDVSLAMDVFDSHHDLEKLEHHLEFFFADRPQSTKLYPTVVIKDKSSGNYTVFMEKATNQKGFEAIQNRQITQVSYRVGPEIAYSATQNLDYFTTILTCLNKRGLKRWLEPAIESY